MLYKGQTITLTLDTDVDITGFDGFIRYRKPNGVEGEWSGTVSNDTVSYDIQTGDIDTAGVWYVQAKATQAAEVRFGKETVIEFRNPV
jgi:hypothetical protein